VLKAVVWVSIQKQQEKQHKIYNMGTKAKKPRPMRSKKSGVKKLNLVKSNLAILNKLK
jgi:hypothetical protein